VAAYTAFALARIRCLESVRKGNYHIGL